ncbi:MAG: glycosyltransferase [bacterium]
MKLLVLTQKIDRNDDVLGFMHGWIRKLAEHCEKITVIALGAGEYDLPKNARVFSLGKEKKNLHTQADSFLSLRGACNQATRQSHFLSFPRRRESRMIDGKSEDGIMNKAFIKISYAINFYKYIWRERKNYNAVFVHMNKEYVLLGGVLWKLWGKKIYLWYNHKKGNILSDIGGYLSDMIFCTSQFSYFSGNKKSKIMPVGINTALFSKDESARKIGNSILCLGRISPVKNIDVLIKAAKILKGGGVDFSVGIIGGPTDYGYYKKLKDMVNDCGLTREINFMPGISNFKAPAEYNKYEICVNLTNSGSMDKTIFEAMACGLIVLASNRSLEKIFPEEFSPIMMFEEKNPDDLARKLAKALAMPRELKNKYQAWARKYVYENHSLEKLAEMIMNYIK